MFAVPNTARPRLFGRGLYVFPEVQIGASDVQQFFFENHEIHGTKLIAYPYFISFGVEDLRDFVKYLMLKKFWKKSTLQGDKLLTTNTTPYKDN